jgi:hypothetical protein
LEKDTQKVVKETNTKLTQPEVKERMCFAINRAIEQTTGHIYFECSQEFIESIYIEKSKDDGSISKGNNSTTTKTTTKKTTFFTSKGQKTSLLFESLCDFLLAWLENKKKL